MLTALETVLITAMTSLICAFIGWAAGRRNCMTMEDCQQRRKGCNDLRDEKFDSLNERLTRIEKRQDDFSRMMLLIMKELKIPVEMQMDLVCVGSMNDHAQVR